MNPETPDHRTGPSSLDWLAFCYVADELEPEQRDSFEQRLLDDQQAREAVAEAVWQAQCLNTAIAAGQRSRSVSLPSQRHLKTNRWLAPVSSLATVAAVLAIVFLSNRQPDPPQLSSDELAEIWVNTLVSLDDEQLEEYVSADFDSIEMDDDNDTWLVAAVDEMEHDPVPSPLETLPETEQGQLNQ